MRLLFIPILLLCLNQLSLVASGTASFLQSAQTTGNPGTTAKQDPAPGASGVVGVPASGRVASPPAAAGQVPSAPQAVPPTATRGAAGGKVTPPAKRPAGNQRAPGAAARKGSASPARSTKRGAKGISMAFTNVPIEQVVSSVMKELGYSYVIDPQVSGSVNLYTQGEVPRDKLFPILEQLLKMNGQAIVRQEDFYVVLPIGASPKIPGAILIRPTKPHEAEPESSKNSEPGEQEGTEPGDPTEETASPESPPPEEEAEEGPTVLTLEGGDDSQLDEAEGVVTYIIPLHYIPSAEMVKMIQAFVSDGAQVVDFQPANLIILTDYRAAIRQVLRLVHLLDTQYFDINQIDLVQVRYNQAPDVAEDLGKIFSSGDQAGGVRLVAIERLNSILVVTHAPGVLAEVKKWIEKLDAPTSGSNLKTYVYHVQNNVATHIAEILAQLFEDGSGLPSGPVGAAGQDAFERRQDAGFLPEGSQRSGTRAQNFGAQNLGPQLSRPGIQGSVRAVVSGNVKIIVSEFDNSLIIQATEADYQFLLQTIKQLDVLPRQALIEAKIYAVELQDDLSFGVAAFLQGRSLDAGPPTTGAISPPSDGSAGGALSMAVRLAFGSERELDLLINALRSKTNVQLMEAPTLLVVDGTEAQINVGAEVPVTTASFGDPVLGGGSTSFVNSIQFRPTGTTLLLVPRISASGIIAMEVAIEVSSATGAALTPTINRSFVRTSLIAKDGQTVAIGGVISDQFTITKNRVPILGDIPVVGALFGQTARNKRRFELIFQITPRVIRNMRTAAEMTLEFRESMRNIFGYVNEKETEQKELIQKRRMEREGTGSEPEGK